MHVVDAGRHIVKALLPFLVLASLLAGCAGGTDHSAARRPAHVKLDITIQRAEELHNALVHYTLLCPAATGSFPHARAACKKLSSIRVMLHPRRMTSERLVCPGIPPEVEVKGTVKTEAVDFSLTPCQKPSARADAARDWLALAPPHGALLRPARAEAAVSPDQKRIAFIRGTRTQSALFVLDLRSRHVQRQTPWSGSERRGMATDPHWVLGGRRIIYSGCGPGVVQTCSLWSIRPGGLDPRNLTGGLDTASHFVVSPNGRWIAFTTALPRDNRAYGGRTQLLAERLDGSDRRTLATGFVSTPESWSVHGVIHLTRYQNTPDGVDPYSGKGETVSFSGHLHRHL